MTKSIALYYPYIHVRDETWLKYAALYWPSMGRLRPPGYETTDSPVAEALNRALGWTIDIDPAGATRKTATPFLKLIIERRDELRARFGLEHLESWPARPRPSFGHTGGSDFAVTSAGGYFGGSRLQGSSGRTDARLEYVHLSKVDRRLLDAVEEAGLGVSGLGKGGYWLGMHPEVANVYISALVERVAGENRLHPITDQVLPHAAVSGWTVERLAEVLLDEHWSPDPARSSQDVLSTYALIAFETIVPRNLDDVPVEKIIEVRETFGIELDAFRTYVEGEAERLSAIEDVREVVAFQEHVRTEVQRNVSARLVELRERLESIGLASGKALANIKTASLPITTATTTFLAGASPVVNVGATIAMSAAAVSSAWRHQRRQAVRESPVGYLFRVERGLNPTSLNERVRSNMRAVWPK